MKGWKRPILTCIWSILLITQITLVFFLGAYNEFGLDGVMYVGWAVWAVSVIFGFVPIFILKNKGEVAKGKSYVHTEAIVTTGIYSIVRHPQYVAGILFSLALVLMAQSWLVLVLGIIVMTLLYIDIIMADSHEGERFGADYERYRKRVPRTNFFLGITRLMKRKDGN